MPTVTRQIQVRQGTAAQWAASSTVPLMGEPCLAIDSGQLAYGDGVNTWPNLMKTQVAFDFTWAPSDNFNRANGDAGANWIKVPFYSISSPPSIVNNAIQGGAGGGGGDLGDALIWRQGHTGLQRYFVQTTLKASGSSASYAGGVVLGAAETSDHAQPGTGTTALFLTVSTATWSVFTGVPASGSYTTVASGTGSRTVGSVVRAEVTGGSNVVLKYGSTTLWTGTIPASVTGKQVGIVTASNGVVVDDFSAGIL